ncbi:MAG: MBL fold metallo-hydrolase [bacterium]
MKFRLAAATTVEPLVNLWPAWPHLIPPVTASLHLLHHQVVTLQSYLKSPATHVRLARDPEYAGGPFSNIPEHRAGEMQELLIRTEEKQRASLEFARALTEFHNRLVDEANGQCLGPFYEQMPESLRGYVELVYDYYHNPSMRFLEGLLYESEYYDKSIQSLRLFQLQNDSRPFFMSTPRLKADEEFEWNIPFESAAVDELFRLDTEPQPLSRIREILQADSAADATLARLLSAEPAPVREPWRERQVRIRYFGHACALVEWNGISILTDPCISASPSQGGLPRFTYDDLPERIDFALVTHSHQDHYVLETLLRLRPRLGCLVVPKSYGVLYGDVSLKLLSQKIGFKHVLELDSLESIPLPDGEIIGVPFLGEHGDLAQGKMAYLVRAGTEQILFAADSDCLDKRMYERVCKTLGPIQSVFLGTESVGAPLTWHNGSLFLRRPTWEQDQTRRYHGCNASRALDLLEAVKASRIYNYAMGKEPWLEHLLGFGSDADSPQLRESRDLIARAHHRGFQIAERPFGKGEIHLSRPQANGSQTASFARPEVDASNPATISADYWREQLRDARSMFTSASVSDISLDQQGVAFSAELAGLLTAFSRERGYSLPVVMLAAFQALLCWFTDQTDIVVTAQGEDFSSSDGGNPTNPAASIVLRTDLTSEPSFLNLLDRVRAVVSMALANQMTPFDPTEFLQVGFRFVTESTATTWRSDLQADQRQPARECLLALELREGPEGINGALRYDGELFADETIATLREHYQVILESAMENPERIITQVSPGLAVANCGNAVGAPEHLSQLEDQFAFQ